MNSGQFHVFLIALLSLLLVSCQDNEPEINSMPPAVDEESWEDYPFDCIFIEDENAPHAYLSVEDRVITDSCIVNRIDSIPDIKASLIGEWELIAHDQGFSVGLENQPCIYLWVEEEEIVVSFTDIYLDTIFRARWDVVQDDWQTKLVFDNQPYTINTIDYFCEDYIGGSWQCDDCYVTIFERR